MAQSLQLQIALLPTEKVLPLLVAEAEGLFHACRVGVRLTMLRGAAVREKAMVEHLYDGYMVNLVSVVLAHLKGSDVRAARVLLRSTRERPMFRLLARPIHECSAAPIKGQRSRVGISRDSIVEYVTYRVIKIAVISDEPYELVDEPDIETRLDALLSGKLDYATLPEPEATVALSQGAREVINDTCITVPPPVLAFHSHATPVVHEYVSRCLMAVDAAAALINETPERYRSLIVDAGLAAPNVSAPYEFPRFPCGEVPQLSDLECMTDWLPTVLASPGPVTTDAAALLSDVTYMADIPVRASPQADR